MLQEAIDEMLSLDSKLLRSLRPLVLRPGFLTKAYLAGQRIRFVNPMRLYLLCSLVFFFVLALFPKEEGFIQITPTSSTSAGSADSNRIEVANDLAVLRALRNRGVDLDAVRRIQEIYVAAGVDSIWKPSDSLTVANPAADSLSGDEFDRFWAPLADRVDDGQLEIAGLEEVPLIGSRLQDRLDRINRTDDKDLRALFDRTMIRHLPKAVFILVPLFALVMKLLYARRSTLYTEHLIFALHLHAFGFLLLVPLHLIPWKIVNVLLSFALPIYLYRATRAVYEQGRVKTLIKLAAVSGSYFFFLALSMIGAALVTVLTM